MQWFAAILGRFIIPQPISMPLVPGLRLGAYEVQGSLGAGGMGEVYRAVDTNLKRAVAIKVLPESFANDPERLARFQREAEVLASLNDPHIAQIYGLERADSIFALVMELVEGQTLADRIAQGPIPLTETLLIAKQIAEALEAAHERGIVHRDLKPANIKVKDDGTVKVLDFGLARAMDPRPGAAAGSKDAAYTNSPTLSLAATQAGVILGTASYMSPEQAKGLQADHRSDIFSFGVVLHEMLTGRQLFQGETAADIIASVLIRDADLATLPADLNPRLIELLKRCLEKNSRKRWQAIGDVRAELDAIAAAPRSAPALSAAAIAPKPLWRRALPVIVVALAFSAFGAAGAWLLTRSSASAVVTRFTIALGEGQLFTNTGRQLVAISPDGERMVYVANQRLYLRSMSELDAKPIPGTEIPDGSVTNPVFSPDGESIAFFVGPTGTPGVIKRVAAVGGAAVTICPAANPLGMAWDQDTIFFGQGSQGIMRVSANGGRPEVVAGVNAGELAHGPQVLTDGQHLLFTVASDNGESRWDTAQIVVQSLRSGERRTLINGGSDARYVPTGHILYAVGGIAYAVPFDLHRLEVMGEPVPVIEGVRRAGANQTGVAHLSFSATGSLMYVPGSVSTPSGAQGLAWVDRAGVATPLKLPPGSYQHARISPDGTRVAFSVNDGKQVNVWVYELNGTASMRRLTFGGNNRFPIWTQNGERIAFQSDRGKDLGIFWQRADTSGTAERLTTANEGTSHVPESWSPSGDHFLYTITQTSRVTLWRFSLREKKAAQFDTVESGNPIGAVFSPDGRWIAYATSDKPGDLSGTVYVQPFPPTGDQYQISKRNAGHHPIWSRDGKELFYEPGSNQFIVVPVQSQPTFTIGNPVSLSGISGGASPTTTRNRDIAPDGKRFIIVVSPDQVQSGTAAAPEIRIVLNWFDELKQRVPVR